MKYETESFFGHQSYEDFLNENQDIMIDFVNVFGDLDNIGITVTFRRGED